MVFELTGLDGTNPICFFAALGILCAGPRHWKLGWREDINTAYLVGPSNKEEVLKVLVEERKRWASQGFLQDVPEPNLKMSSHEFHVIAERLLALDRKSGGNSAHWLGVLGNEIILTKAKPHRTKPFAFEFTAAQMYFLNMARKTNTWTKRGKSFETQFENTLFAPWRNTDKVQRFRWDSTYVRKYAYAYKKPSGDASGKSTEAGGQWLAFRGTELLSTAPDKGNLYTTCVGGTHYQAWFRWPLWFPAASKEEVRALLHLRELASLTPAQQRARGVFRCLRSNILRVGKFSNLSPSVSAGPEDDPVLLNDR